MLLRRGQEPAGGRDGETVALAPDTGEGQAVHVPRPCDPVRRLAGGAQQHRPVAPVLADGERQGATDDGAAAQQIEKRLEATKLLRKQIETLPSNTPQDIERKAKMFENVEDQTKRLAYAADMLLAASWEVKNVGELESALNGMLAEVEYKFKDLPAEQLEDEAKKRLRKAGIEGRFHWPLEFPEVFVDRGGFNAFVCNPPFMGGQKIPGIWERRTGTIWSSTWLHGKRGSADLCAYFTLRAASLLRDRGQFGFLATNTIAQGDTREVGLDQLTADGCVIPEQSPPARGRARRTWKLPTFGAGGAVEFAIPTRRETRLGHLLISHRAGHGRRPAAASRQQHWKSFIGSCILGNGFVIEPEEAQEPIDKDPRNRDVLFPYLNGEDLNSRPDQSPSRWVINFCNWPLTGRLPQRTTRAGGCGLPRLSGSLTERAKPERDRLATGDATSRDRAKRWWQFARPTLRTLQKH